MDFRNASLEELKQFVKEHKIKGVSALRKPALIEFLEKNYSGEADPATKKNEEKPRRNDAEKIKKTEKVRKREKVEQTEKPAEAEQEEQQEKSEDAVKKVDRNRAENGQRSVDSGRRQHRSNTGRQTNRNGKRQDYRSQGYNNRNNNSNHGNNTPIVNNGRKDHVQENKPLAAEMTKLEMNMEKAVLEKSAMEEKKVAVESSVVSEKKAAYEKSVIEEKNTAADTEIKAEVRMETKPENRQEGSSAQQEPNGPELDSGKMAHGILEVMQEGYGFIRSANYLPGDQDIYVSPAQIRRFGLKTGDIIMGNIRVKTQGEKFGALLYVASVNGESPASIAGRKAFEDLTPIFPNERINMDGEDSPIPIRMIDLLSPIGKGQRGMIVSPPKTGKTTLLKQIAKCISTRYSEIHLLVLLIDERPEEVTDIRESIEGPNVEVIYSTFDELPEHHKRVSEMVIERAKRLVEQKKDVVILLDSITRLARAYNLTVPPSGRTLSGGLDPAALHMPKKFFGAARNMREGGSLTILATALVETGSKMDDVVFEEFKGTGNMELVLDRKLAEKRIFPAIDIAKSSTRRDDLLLSPEEQEVVYALHKILSGNKAEDMLEDVLKLFVRTKNNKEFIYYVKKSLLRK
ncbi:transcription termination factor Rho [Coprococcus sp. HCN-4056]|uniref:transcription termination factor Rho n=1 Tax=Coprococcus sp. HCN-4056 TaxID=3134671 RepID=UPI0030C39010